MELAPVLMIGTLVLKLTDLSKYITNQRWRDVVTQLYAFAIGVVVVLLSSAANVTSAMKINDTTLAGLNAGSKVLVGLILTSVISTVYDFKKAIDGSDSAATPSLIPDHGEH